MFTPPMPNLPGAGAMSDTLDFVKNLWGSMSVPGTGIPGITAPTLSMEDLDKKINDLKAVEAWLNVNLSMLRGTIHTLEVQRNTIATLKSMGEAMANAVKQPGADPASVLAASPFASAFFPSTPGDAAARNAQAANKTGAAPGAAANTKAPAATAPDKASPPSPAPAQAQPADPGQGAAAGDEAAGASSAAFTNPTAWWNLLQDQFRQAVNSTMSPEALAQATAMAQDAARRMTPGGADSNAAGHAGGGADGGSGGQGGAASDAPDASAPEADNAKRGAGRPRGRGINGQT